MKFLKSNRYFILLVTIICLFYYPFLLKGKLPIPADTIVGMYHPFRDQLKPVFPSGYPFKNFLITDPVRQQYLWRKLAVEEMKKGNLPVWNPYSFSGTPLLANFQTAAFYPLNVLFFILPFDSAWSLLVLLSSLLTGIFLFIYIRNLNISPAAAFVGSISFIFSGFSIAWLEWNTINQVVFWLILSLLAVDKIRTYHINEKHRFVLLWLAIFTFSLIAAFLAGHLQIFLYGFLLVLSYLTLRLTVIKKNKVKLLGQFVLSLMIFALLTLPQSWPSLRFILESNRNFDQGLGIREGFFLPWPHLVQFLAPDYFGNPVTGNYFGVWNYAEFVATVGILGLILSLISLFYLKRKLVLFYFLVAFTSLVAATPNILSSLLYQFNLPFIATSQPTRILFLTAFSLSVLAAFGFDKLRKISLGKVLLIMNSLGIIFLILWFVSYRQKSNVSLRNLAIPTSLYMAYFVLIMLLFFKKIKKLIPLIPVFLIFFHVLELLRFSWKFTPFSPASLLFPPTNLLSLVDRDKDVYRIMAIDRRILPPNFSINYRLQDVSGYDPLYLKTYAQLASSWDQDKADLSPASFNRIITPKYLDSFITDLMNVKYIFSYGPVDNSKLTLVESEGDTYLYRNNDFYPRAFLVARVIPARSRDEELNIMFSLKNSLRSSAVSKYDLELESRDLAPGERVNILKYEPNRIMITSTTEIERLLIISDIYSTFWKAKINGMMTAVYPVDYNLRGLVVPPGENTIELYSSLL